MIFELCEDLDIPCVEADFGAYDVHTADEAFVTGTPFCMLPVVSLDGVRIGEPTEDASGIGVFGPVSSRLMQAWSDRVGLDIPAQLRAFAGSSPTKGTTPYQFKAARS